MNPQGLAPETIVQVTVLLAAILLLACATLLVAAVCYYHQAKCYLERLLQSPSPKRDSSGRLYRERL